MYYKDQWQPDEKAFFEYHCFESDESDDAIVWHHTHQQVRVIKEQPSDAFEGTLLERGEAGQPKVYKVQFADGLIYDAFEDELLTDPAGYERPDY